MNLVYLRGWSGYEKRELCCLQNGTSRPEVFCKKGLLRNFTKFTGKILCQSLFFNKDAGLRPATLLKKRLWYRCIPVNFVKFLRTPFYITVVEAAFGKSKVLFFRSCFSTVPYKTHPNLLSLAIMVLFF